MDRGPMVKALANVISALILLLICLLLVWGVVAALGGIAGALGL